MLFAPMHHAARDPEPTLSAFCRRLLGSGDLESKLIPPFGSDGAPLDDTRPAAAENVTAPARDPGLELRSGAPPLPRPGELGAREARARCLARFAHHELMAAELFAWALLRWPSLPPALRGDLARALADEQRHCRLYLDRLAAHDSRLADHPLSNTFWRHVPVIAARGPAAFLAAMGLTWEQANLDFTLLYRDAFRSAGDEATAVVLQRVHDDELGHVGLAARWMPTLAEGADEVERYEASVPFPLSAARAKARRFDAASRRRAGLGEAFIEHVRTARSTQERTPRRRRT